jgi:hypothetical protein
MDAWQHCSGTNGDRMPRHGRDAQDNRQAGRRPYCHGTAPAFNKVRRQCIPISVDSAVTVAMYVPLGPCFQNSHIESVLQNIS